VKARAATASDVAAKRTYEAAREFWRGAGTIYRKRWFGDRAVSG